MKNKKIKLLAYSALTAVCLVNSGLSHAIALPDIKCQPPLSVDGELQKTGPCSGGPIETDPIETGSGGLDPIKTDPIDTTPPIVIISNPTEINAEQQAQLKLVAMPLIDKAVAGLLIPAELIAAKEQTAKIMGPSKPTSDLQVGAIMAFAKNSCPTNWSETNGQLFPFLVSGAINWDGLNLFIATEGVLPIQQVGADIFVKLPDLRGEFIRGWDHGRGVDPGRQNNTWQAQQQANAIGSLSLNPVKANHHAGGQWGAWFGVVESISGQINITTPTNVDIRPRNQAFLHCIKVK